MRRGLQQSGCRLHGLLGQFEILRLVQFDGQVEQRGSRHRVGGGERVVDRVFGTGEERFVVVGCEEEVADLLVVKQFDLFVGDFGRLGEPAVVASGFVQSDEAFGQIGVVGHVGV